MNITVDPTGHYASKNKNPSDVVQACGILTNYALMGNATISANLAANYTYFTGWSEPHKDAAMDDEGVYQYPEDPPLHPLIKLEQGNEEVFIYPYAIVCVRVGGKFAHTARMD